MATGRGNQLTKQVGEYLVAAELARLGLIAATFSGSVPDYDIIPTDSVFRSVPIQVKTITGTSWQFDIKRFADVRLDGRRQIVGQPVQVSSDIVCVMVALGGYGRDRFYVLPLATLQKLLIDHHQQYLTRFAGVRPKKFDSFHTAIKENDLAAFRDGWRAELEDRHRLRLA